jgi:Ca-activated chloride channel family protein
MNGQVATTARRAVFRNDTQWTLEARTFFRSPKRRRSVEFAIWENGKKLVGEVRSREEARRIYDEIVRRQKDPGLLNMQARTFSRRQSFLFLRIQNKKLELTYTQVLKAENGTVSYRYPLGTGRNVWRPVPMMRDDSPTLDRSSSSGPFRETSRSPGARPCATFIRRRTRSTPR